MITELNISQLRKTCDPQILGCETSDQVEELPTLIGQERAVRALRFGLGIQERGFNILVAGVPGTGRTTAVRRFLEDLAQARPVPSDWCYVNNFADPYRPKALRLPAGRGRDFQREMEAMVQAAQSEIRRAFDSEEYAAQREQVTRGFQARRDELLAEVNRQAEEKGFVIQITPVGVATVPMRDGKPMEDEEFMALSEDERAEMALRRETLQSAIEAAFRQGRSLEKDAQEAVEKLDRQVAVHAIAHLIQDVKESHADIPEVLSYLDEVQDNILNNLGAMRGDEEGQQQQQLPFLAGRAEEHALRRYQVNVVVDNAELKGAPVVIESNPTYGNLFGRMEQEAQFGTLVTDFTMVRGGALHAANGGFLVLQVEEVLRNPFAWEGLKRALANRHIAIEDGQENYGFMTTRTLRPEPIPLDAKVILIGRPDMYYALHAYDEEFGELFKVKADFDTHMARTDSTVRDYAAFACALCNEEQLTHLDNSALAELVEHGSRMAEDQEKLSTRFGEIADVIREASHYATADDAPYVTADHVRRTIDERFYRSNLMHERIREMVDRGMIMIDTDGLQVGQVNGLSVLSMGDVAFGQPSRITASIGLGRDGLVDIEREANLGGPIHTKGVLILSGYLTEKYAYDKPLSLSARLVFEQSYSGVEGDSAASTELYAILSSLSGLPIKQSIAVTGSVNQKGNVQAIGGVNEKIEGFFEVCQAKGLTGEQGVMIPSSNVQHLMLKQEVVEAVRAGRFHVWAVDTIDDGIEILTGVPAGKPQEDGAYAEDTVNGRVDRRLTELAQMLRDFGQRR